MKEKKKVEAKVKHDVRVGDTVGLGTTTIGGPATGGRYPVPLVVKGTTHRVVRLFKKFDYITNRFFLYAEVEPLD